MSTKRMTGFTHVHLPLVSDYSGVLRARQDSLMSIQLLLTSTKPHDRSSSRVFSTRQQSLTSSVLLLLHKPNTRVVLKISRGATHVAHAVALLLTRMAQESDGH